MPVPPKTCPMSTCSHCCGPLAGPGFAGRPHPDRPPAAYCCYGCLSLGESSPAPAAGGVGVRLAVGAIVAAQSMTFGLALNLHDDVPGAVRWVVQSAMLAGAVVTAGLLGPPLARTAVAELRWGRLTIEMLFLLTLSGALAASLTSHITGEGPVYYEVVSVLLVVYTLGKLVGARARAAAVAGSEAWAGGRATCRLVAADGAAVRTVPVAGVRAGDVAEVYAGETVPVDGVIRAGVGYVSEAPLTGEPFPVVRRPGDRVAAGTAAYDATFRVEATAAGTERQLDRLLAAVEAARQTPTSFQGQADRLARLALPLILAVAVGTFGYWSFLTAAGWQAGLFNALSVLLVACPCVFGLATPVVTWAVLGRLAERGLVVRSGDAVERLAGIDRVLFDKTGTLTDERFALVDVVVADGFDRAEVLGWVAAVETHSPHPLARAFAGWAVPAGVEVRAVRHVAGCGVEAEMTTPAGRSHSLRIGRPGWAGDGVGRLRASGHRVCVMADGVPAAEAVVAERLRGSAAEALAGLARLGLPVEVLTGDAAGKAEAVGLPPARAGLSAEDKRAAAAVGRPLVVGDGVNDAAALAVAHVGVALASGTDLAVTAADATLYHDDLRVLPWAVGLSRAAVRTMRRCLLLAAGYNLVGVTLAAAGVLHPVAAALLMVASSLTLLFAASRVGVRPDHCTDDTGKMPVPQRTGGSHLPLAKSFVHGLAVALQGVVAVLLLDAARDWAAGVVGGFAIVGVGVAWVWYRRPDISHHIDMCVGMLTLGNLGMLVGWWADAGFGPLADGCCHCVYGGLGRPWMWVGMLVGANAAMRWLGRRPPPADGVHVPAMYTGGNVGMVVGMVAGGWAAGQVVTESVPLAAGLAFAGMTAGMIGGMLVGTRTAEGVIRAGRRWRAAVSRPAGRSSRPPARTR